MTNYLLNTKTNRKFEIIGLNREKNLLTLKGETGGVFEEPYDKARLKELGYQYVQQDVPASKAQRDTVQTAGPEDTEAG